MPPAFISELALLLAEKDCAKFFGISRRSSQASYETRGVNKGHRNINKDDGSLHLSHDRFQPVMFIFDPAKLGCTVHAHCERDEET